MSRCYGFKVYASVDGYGFDGGTVIAGGGATAVTLTGYDPTMPYYFKVTATKSRRRVESL